MSATNPKDNSRKKGVAAERYAQRQQEAVERKQARAKRTPEQQLQVLRERGVTSGREWGKLIAAVNNGSIRASGKHDKHAARLPQTPKKKVTT